MKNPIRETIDVSQEHDDNSIDLYDHEDFVLTDKILNFKKVR